MVYRQEEVVNKVQRLLADVETEVVEYKSAKNNFDFDDLGKYFSALSNEANLRCAQRSDDMWDRIPQRGS